MNRLIINYVEKNIHKLDDDTLKEISYIINTEIESRYFKRLNNGR